MDLVHTQLLIGGILVVLLRPKNLNALVGSDDFPVQVDEAKITGAVRYRKGRRLMETPLKTMTIMIHQTMSFQTGMLGNLMMMMKGKKKTSFVFDRMT